MTASIEVTAPIAEGTIIVLRNIDMGDDPAVMVDVTQQLRDVAGHDRFLVMQVAGDGDVETWGPDTDLRSRIEALVGETRAQRPSPPVRPGGAAGWQGGSGRRPAPPVRP